MYTADDSDDDFDRLVRDGSATPTDGWDFSWFDGRAIENRPSWGYSRLLVPLYSRAEAVLDVQTGGAEVYSEALDAAHPRPSTVLATESWGPNLELARAALAPFGGRVDQVSDAADFPLADASVDVVSSRHPTANRFDEVARVLRPGGTFISQQVVGLATNREIYEFFLGPQDHDPEEGLRLIGEGVAAVGLRLDDLRYEETKVEFFDVGALVYFLRKVLWTVPDFTVERYRDKLIEVHAEILQNGAFVSYSRHALVLATRL
ncbi:class I SAM-dependent methyltransferase [Lacisediminihabitans changchengi]|uniref:Class I SAM-dependent methyltransferase n=1 Tax=Lacisediminihabitans changchengi TaxID=2787634 RepID=A0A934SN44_9MICO|nr:methyltransferase domain-containing protein [Lacisediminihabitans changchengi]MBK4348583.1 class I SAM-dependent methyltransferase [Lacisediminihabitans changchengi]